jgi:hypothetical protein
MGSDPRPIDVTNRLRLGDRRTLIEEGFGSVSGENEGSWQMQERKYTWGRHGPRMKIIPVAQQSKSMLTLKHAACLLGLYHDNPAVLIDL